MKTPYLTLVRYVPSGILFARFRLRGKLIWKSLKTDRITVSKVGLADLEKEQRQKMEAGQLLAKGKIFFGDALSAYRVKGFRPVVPRNKKDMKKRFGRLKRGTAAAPRFEELKWLAAFPLLSHAEPEPMSRQGILGAR